MSRTIISVRWPWRLEALAPELFCPPLSSVYGGRGFGQAQTAIGTNKGKKGQGARRQGRGCGHIAWKEGREKAEKRENKIKLTALNVSITTETKHLLNVFVKKRNKHCYK